MIIDLENSGNNGPEWAFGDTALPPMVRPDPVGLASLRSAQPVGHCLQIAIFPPPPRQDYRVQFSFSLSDRAFVPTN